MPGSQTLPSGHREKATLVVRLLDENHALKAQCKVAHEGRTGGNQVAVEHTRFMGEAMGREDTSPTRP